MLPNYRYAGAGGLLKNGTILGFSGKAIGTCLSQLLELVLEEQLLNEKGALLAKAKELLREVSL